MTSEELEIAMKNLGMTQGDLAKKMGVRPETVHRWLRGVNGKIRRIPGPVIVAINLLVDQRKIEEAQVTEDAL